MIILHYHSPRKAFESATNLQCGAILKLGGGIITWDVVFLILTLLRSIKLFPKCLKGLTVSLFLNLSKSIPHSFSLISL